MKAGKAGAIACVLFGIVFFFASASVVLANPPDPGAFKGFSGKWGDKVKITFDNRTESDRPLTLVITIAGDECQVDISFGRFQTPRGGIAPQSDKCKGELGYKDGFPSIKFTPQWGSTYEFLLKNGKLEMVEFKRDYWTISGALTKK